MDINDYNTRLSQARMNYRDSADELKEHYNSEIEDLSNLHSSVQKKQRENFAESKNEIERNVAATVDKQNSEVKESMQKRTEQFRNETASQQEAFEADRRDLQRKFDDRLNYLRDSYGKDLASRERTQSDLLDSAENRYQNRTDRNSDYFQKSVDNLDYSTRTAMKEQKDAHDIEKRAQESRHSNEMQDTVRSGNSARNKMVEKQQNDLQSLRNAQMDELRNLKDHHASSREIIYDQKNKETAKLAGNFRELTDDIAARNNANNTRQAKQSREQIKELERQYAQTNYQNKREMEEKLKGGNVLDKDELKSAELQAKFDTRMKNVNSNIDDLRYKNQLDKERMSSSFQDSVRERNLSFAQQIDAKDKDMREFKTNTLKDTRESNDKIVSDYKFKLNQALLESEQNSIKDRKSTNQRLSSQRVEFGRVVNQMSDMNREAVSKLQEEHADEKTKFIENSRRQEHDKIEDLKDNYNNIITKKESSLNQRLESKEKELESTITRYEDKLALVTGKTQKELESVKKIEADRRVEDFREFKRQMRLMSDGFTKEKISMKDEFDRKLSNAKHNSDVTLSKTVQRYETQLERERTDTRRHFKTKIKELESNYQRLADQSELEKELIRNQFERRIEEMKQVNAMQLEELSDTKTTRA
ncbi:hypothetical protein [Halobacteriovorax sp. HLS]|uniref:hypothetical protein n=1 Tax=Halobacteriovorax sp. HLS TaxID=2234000 RepID=UPI000FD74C7C|nr:hypothetical protein [Halobacteriovorax sp. HLS]